MLVTVNGTTVTAGIKEGTTTSNELIERLKREKAFAKVDFASALDLRGFVGRAPEQVGEFVEEHVAPVRKRYVCELGMKAELNV